MHPFVNHGAFSQSSAKRRHATSGGLRKLRTQAWSQNADSAPPRPGIEMQQRSDLPVPVGFTGTQHGLGVTCVAGKIRKSSSNAACFPSAVSHNTEIGSQRASWVSFRLSFAFSIRSIFVGGAFESLPSLFPHHDIYSFCVHVSPTYYH